MHVQWGEGGDIIIILYLDYISFLDLWLINRYFINEVIDNSNTSHMSISMDVDTSIRTECATS
jgi:hypothetical protein